MLVQTHDWVILLVSLTFSVLTFESSIHNDVEPSYPEDFDEKMQRQRDLAFEYLLKIINSTMKNSEGSCQTTSEERIAPCQ